MSTAEKLERTAQQGKKENDPKACTLGLIVQILQLPSLQKDLTNPMPTSHVRGAFGLWLGLRWGSWSFEIQIS